MDHSDPNECTPPSTSINLDNILILCARAFFRSAFIRLHLNSLLEIVLVCSLPLANKNQPKKHQTYVVCITIFFLSLLAVSRGGYYYYLVR